MYFYCIIAGYSVGAPIIMSQPHFYEGAQQYIDAIDGISPSSDHKTNINIEPVSDLKENMAVEDVGYIL